MGLGLGLGWGWDGDGDAPCQDPALPLPRGSSVAAAAPCPVAGSSGSGFFCLYLVTLGGLRLIRRHLASGMENFTCGVAMETSRAMEEVLTEREGSSRRRLGTRPHHGRAAGRPSVRPGTQKDGDTSPAGVAVLTGGFLAATFVSPPR